MSVARFKPQAEPATPPAGYIYFFCDIADDLLYLKFDTGTVVPVKPVGGGTGDLLSDGSVPLSANWDIGAYTIRALGFESDVATGTAPFVVASETMVTNLNTELLGGKDLATVESDYAAAIAAAVAGLYDHKGAYDASTNTPDLDTAPSGILKGDAYTVSVAGTFFAVAVEAGDVLIADQDNPVDAGDWTIVNRNIDSSAFATAAQGTTADAALPKAGGTMTGAIDFGGFDLTNAGVAFLTEQAAAEADVAGKGQIWVKNTTPCELWFTDDAGTDVQLGVGGSGYGEVFSADIPTVANQDYVLWYDAPFPGTVTMIRTESVSGTCTLTGKVNTTALGGTANSVSSTAQEQAHASSNTFVKGDKLQFTVSANSSCLTLAVAFYITRTG